VLERLAIGAPSIRINCPICFDPALRSARNVSTRVKIAAVARPTPEPQPPARRGTQRLHRFEHLISVLAHDPDVQHGFSFDGGP